MRRLALIAFGTLLMGATVVGTLNANRNFFSSVQIGSSGGTFTNMVAGTCTLSAGTCNAVLAGATGTSQCYAEIGGTYAVDAGGATCSVQADAGSGTVWCAYPTLTAYPAAIAIGIHCDN